MALVVGVLNILPPILIGLNISNSGNDFVLAQQSGYRDEFFQYLPRAREVFDGHFPPRNIFSGTSGPSPLNPLPSALFSPFLFLFGGNLNWAYISAQFVFAVIIFLLFFWLGWAMVRSKLWAVFFALVGVFTQIPQLIFRYYDRDFLGISLKKFIPIVRTPIDKMYFARIDDPMLTYPILLAAIISFYFFWIKPKAFIAIVAGIFAGLLAYTYLHYWLFWMIFLGVIFSYTLLFFRQDRTRFRHGVILWLTVLLVLAPYAYNYFDFTRADYSNDYASRLGKEDGRFLLVKYISTDAGRTIIFNHIFYLVLLAGVYYFYFKKSGIKYKSTQGVIFMALITAMFLVWQIPLFTGFGFSLMHFNKPIGLAVYIILFNLAHDFLKDYSQKKPRQVRLAVSVVLVILAVLLISKHIVNVFAFKNPPLEFSRRYDFPQDIVSSWGWINVGIEGEPSIVSSSLITSLYLASYTSTRPYLASGFLSPLTNTEIEDRFYVSNKLFRVSSGMLGQRFNGFPLADCSPSSCFKDAQLNTDFGKTRWYLTSAAWSQTSFVNEPERVLKKYEDMSVDWRQTDSDFVYYGPWEKQFSRVDFSQDPNLKLVYRNPLVEIYRVVR